MVEELETAQGTEATGTVDEPEQTAVSAQGADEEGTGTEEAELAPETKPPSRAAKRIHELVSKLNEANTRLKEYESQGSVQPPATAGQQFNAAQVQTESYDSRRDEHPALRGLQEYEDGTVLYHGDYVSPESVKHQYELEQRLASLETTTNQYQESLKRQAVEQAQAALFNDVQTAVVEMRESSLSGLPKELQADVDSILLQDVDNYITREINSGKELTAKLVEDASKSAMDRARRLFGAFGEAQIKDNQEYAEKHKVKPGGQPGVPVPKPVDKMSAKERASYIERLGIKINEQLSK